MSASSLPISNTEALALATKALEQSQEAAQRVRHALEQMFGYYGTDRR